MGDLKVLGLGYARTGTASLKRALELLGFPTYHMFEIFNRPADASLWLRVDSEPENRKILFDQIFASYEATVDLPSILYWRDLIKYNPNAKIILTLRDSNAWYDSFQSTILKAFESISYMLGHYVSSPAMYQMMKKLPLSQFKGCLSDREKIIDVFEKHNADVIKHVPPEKLLIYKVDQGWKPLCNFLNVPVPEDIPFPHINDRQELSHVIKNIEARGRLLMLVISILLLFFILFLFSWCTV